MGTSTFQTGAHVEIDRKDYVLLRKVDDGMWQLEETRTKRIHEYSDDKLRTLYASGQLIFASQGRPLASSDQAGGKIYHDTSEEQYESAKVRRAYALAVKDVPNTSAALIPAIKAVWERLKQSGRQPHWTTVYRWKVRLLGSGNDIAALVAADAQRGNRTRRFPPEVLHIVNEAIDHCYLTRERKTIQDTLDYALVRVLKENSLRPQAMKLPLPTRRTVQSAIAAISAFDRYVARFGHLAAVKRFRSVSAHRTTALPLERAEIDHTLLDLMVIDDTTSLPLGRPWVTACIDDFTRCVLGISISFEPPSHLTVAHCLKDAFLPKTWLHERYPSINNKWEAHGVMRELVVDNGVEFHSKSLEAACLSLCIEIHYSARKTPWFKGKIERFLGTLNAGVAHGNPGTTFRNIFDKDDYDPSKHAVIRLSVMQEIVRRWIADYYHQKPHRSLHVPPAVMWSSNIRPEDIQVPDDPSRLDAILGRSEQRKLTHKGVELDGLLYNSPELADLRRSHGDKLDVEVRVNDMDLGKVIVLSPDKKRMFNAPALFQDYANRLTRWQHRICKRFAARQMEKFEPSAWLEAKDAISRLIDEEFMRKKQRTRTKIARFKGGTSPEAKSEEAPAPALPVALDAPVPEPAAALAQAVKQAANDAKPLPVSDTRPARRLKPIVRERNPGAIARDQGKGN